MKGKYNGWTNYETWCVSLWMDNEEASYNAALGEASAALEEAEGDYRLAVSNLADSLREQYRGVWDAIADSCSIGVTVWPDLMNAALSEVDWSEIAEHQIDAVREAEQFGVSEKK